VFNLDNYETVEDRLIKFWADHPGGRIETAMVFYDDNRVVFRAEIYFNADDPHPKATGYAEEVRGASPVNKTSHVENGETSAIGRGLANCNYATRGSRPSREEMSKVARSSSPVAEAREFIEEAHKDREALVMAAFPGGKVVKIKNPNDPASPAQLGKIRVELARRSIPKDEQTQFVAAMVQRDLSETSDLSKGEASRVIDELING
jgi:hypothetical protein